MAIPLLSSPRLPLGVYLLSEIIFFLYYRLVLLPGANDRLPDYKSDSKPLDHGNDGPYRDYGPRRHGLMVRILDRIESSHKTTESEALGGNGSDSDPDEHRRGPKGRPSSRPPPAPYRDYGRKRHKLMLRILERIERTCLKTGHDVRDSIADFLMGWFYSEVEGVSVRELLRGASAAGGDDDSKEGGMRMPPSMAETEGWSSIASSVSGASLQANGPSDGACAAAAAATSNGASTTWNGTESGGGGGRSVRFDPATSRQSSSRAAAAAPLFPRRDDMDSFLSWAFFASHYSSLTSTQLSELDKIYSILEERHSVTFHPGCTKGLKPMNLTLDDVDPTYRPLGVYIFFMSLYCVGCCALRCLGFKFYRAESGLTYWHRPGHRSSNDEGENDEGPRPPPTPSLPLLFFHGIAPGGLTLYLPMILGGLCYRHRSKSILLFENRPISFFPTLNAVDEVDTAKGVLEAMELHLSPDEKEFGVTVAGHSFGTFQVTWMLRCEEVRRHIRQVVVMDPVSILLSEPDVITNFVYGQRRSLTSLFTVLRPIFLFPIFYLLRMLSYTNPSLSELVDSVESDSQTPPLLRKLSSIGAKPKQIPKGRYNKIWMVQSELFIEHYLRRNFWWYNNELFLDAIPSDCKVVVCLSGKDEILSARKVIREVEIHMDQRMTTRDAGTDGGSIWEGDSGDNWEVLHWPMGGHAHCVPRPEMWGQIRDTMVRQEEDILTARCQALSGGEGDGGCWEEEEE